MYEAASNSGTSQELIKLINSNEIIVLQRRHDRLKTSLKRRQKMNMFILFLRYRMHISNQTRIVFDRRLTPMIHSCNTLMYLLNENV